MLKCILNFVQKKKKFMEPNLKHLKTFFAGIKKYKKFVTIQKHHYRVVLF